MNSSNEFSKYTYVRRFLFGYLESFLIHRLILIFAILPDGYLAIVYFIFNITVDRFKIIFQALFLKRLSIR